MAGAGRGQFAGFGGIGNGGNDFPNPFNDVASLSIPTNLRSVLYWAEFVYSMFGTYSMAMERTISYFLTEVEILNASEDEIDKWKPFLDDTLGAVKILQNMLRNRACYGNSFGSLLVPFHRFLCCPKCGSRWALKTVADNAQAFNYSWSIPEFRGTCPSCKVGTGWSGAWLAKDEPQEEERKLKLKIWSPHEIELLHDPFTHDVAYLWRIPEDYKQDIRRGNLYHLDRAPLEVIRAIHKNQMYRFNEDAIFHMKEPTLAGILNRGWGLPRILMNFRQIWYVQVLRRMQEAIALDYVVPFRVITPMASPGGKLTGGLQDPLKLYNGQDFRAQVNRMIKKRRQDPASIQVMGLPIQFQMFGADANQLAPRDLLDQGMEQLLNDAGTPVELYNGSLQLQTAPVALRLFESTWHHLIHDANDFLSWLIRQISQAMSWETVDAKLKRVTIADNLEKQMMAAQLYMSQALSGTTVLGELGYNWRKEQARIAEEARTQAELQSRTQEEMEQAGFAQQIAKGQGGGDPSQGGGQAQGGGQGDPSQMMPGMANGGPVSQYLSSMGPNTPQTPQSMMQVADSLANELLGLPESIKDSQLRALNTANKALHDLVKGKMDEKREATRSAAGGQALGQMQQGAQMQQAA